MATDYISALNAGSGLDTSSIITALVDARRVPKETLINDKVNELDVKVSAFGTLQNTMANFSSLIESYSGETGLSITQTGTSFTSEITDADLATAFDHEIEIAALATAQTLVFDGYSSSTETLGAGTLNFDFGNWSNSSFTSNGSTGSVTISDGTDTIEEVAAAVTDAGLGISASVIKISDSNYALVFQTETGEDNAVKITATETVSGSGLADLDFQTYDSSIETVSASDAELSFDGVSLTRDTNTISDVISGVTLTLLDTTSSTEQVIGEYNATAAYAVLNDFVGGVSEMTTLLKTAYSRGGDTGVKGDLAGDPIIQSIINQFESLTTSGISGFGDEAIYLANFGVMTNRDGSLSLDKDVFEAEFAENPDYFSAIFNSRVTTSSSVLTGTVSGDTYVPGSYNFELNGGAATITGDNMSIDGADYFTSSGNTEGLILTTNVSSLTATVYLGRSLLESYQNLMTEYTEFGSDIDDRLAEYALERSDRVDDLAELSRQIESLREQYTLKFANMEIAIASLNQTGDSLTGMMDAWRAMGNRR